MRTTLAALMTLAMTLPAAHAQSNENRIDLVRPDAPELALHGTHPVGVRTVEISNPGQTDILNVVAGQDHPTYDRLLTLEVWYPAADDTARGGDYRVLLRDGVTEATIHGLASRDAEPASSGPYPLVILSHGYPGNRFLMSHLAENLATKGYVVASIDHKDSTYDDQGKFASTLVNRPLDQIFTLNEMARMSADTDGFLSGLVDADNTAVIGYSMGGYGAVITAGGGVTEKAVSAEWGAPDSTLAIHQAGSDALRERLDNRIKAIVAIAPWGMQRGFWDGAGLSGIETPIFYIAGSIDDVSGYGDGVRALYDGTVNAERFLLTFEGANHNVAAPMPAPTESWTISEKLGYAPFDHYADPVWDTVRMNNIAQHFVTAFLGRELKNDTAMEPYLDIIEHASDGYFAKADDGTARPEHTYWLGFANRTAAGLSLLQAKPAQR